MKYFYLILGFSAGFGVAYFAYQTPPDPKLVFQPPPRPKKVAIKDTFEPRVQNAKLLVDRRQYREAAMAFETLWREQPHRTDLLQALGICYLNLGLVNKAASVFKSCIQREPQNGIHYAWLGYCYHYNNDFPRALSNYQSAASWLPAGPEKEKALRKVALLKQMLDPVNGTVITKKQQRTPHHIPSPLTSGDEQGKRMPASEESPHE